MINEKNYPFDKYLVSCNSWRMRGQQKPFQKNSLPPNKCLTTEGLLNIIQEIILESTSDQNDAEEVEINIVEDNDQPPFSIGHFSYILFEGGPDPIISN